MAGYFIGLYLLSRASRARGSIRRMSVFLRSGIRHTAPQSARGRAKARGTYFFVLPIKGVQRDKTSSLRSPAGRRRPPPFRDKIRTVSGAYRRPLPTGIISFLARNRATATGEPFLVFSRRREHLLFGLFALAPSTPPLFANRPRLLFFRQTETIV